MRNDSRHTNYNANHKEALKKVKKLEEIQEFRFVAQ